VFYLDSRGIYRVEELDAFPWLVHGFGTRNSDIPSLFPNLATLKQVHSGIWVPAEGRTGVIGEGDALIENTPGAVIAVKTADCIPILLVEPDLRLVAAVHAGWRGTAARIVRGTSLAMGASGLHAAIGPGIGKCCYEVGPEVSAQLGEQGRTCIDLAEINRRQLLEAGVTPEHIYASNLCTMCQVEQFHSFRRDAERAGRQYSFAGVR
jgi:YfiH family protein